MPLSTSGACGVDARSESVVDVRTGVRWMWGCISLWASSIDARMSGGVLEISAMTCYHQSEGKEDLDVVEEEFAARCKMMCACDSGMALRAGQRSATCTLDCHAKETLTMPIKP